MTDSFTRYWKSSASRRVAGCGLVLSLLLGAWSAPARAEGAVIESAKIELTDEGYQLNADIELQLSPVLQEAVRKGVPLYFVAEFQLNRGRWYWLDQSVVSAKRDRRVSYAPLTEQYRVITSGISQNVATFDDVRKLLSRVRAWTIAEKGQLKPGERYDAALRFRLDTAQLPKPFQLNVITSKDWALSSDWFRWGYTP